MRLCDETLWIKVDLSENFNPGGAKPAEERKLRGAAMVRGGSKGGSPLFQALAGGPLKLTGLAQDSWNLVEDTGDVGKAWTRLPLEGEEESLLQGLRTKQVQGSSLIPPFPCVINFFFFPII